jgi:uncharacterized protein DUF5996
VRDDPTRTLRPSWRPFFKVPTPRSLRCGSRSLNRTAPEARCTNLGRLCQLRRQTQLRAAPDTSRRPLPRSFRRRDRVADVQYSGVTPNPSWPNLPLAEWADTCDTLQLWTQVVGKVRMVLAPLVNHWWNVTLYVTSRGLTTSPIPCGARTFEILFDFVDHRLRIETSDGAVERISLGPMVVADFHAEVMARLERLGIRPHIWTMPSEIENAVPFELDRTHAQYDPAMVARFWQALVQADRVPFSLHREGIWTALLARPALIVGRWVNLVGYKPRPIRSPRFSLRLFQPSWHCGEQQEYHENDKMPAALDAGGEGGDPR